MILKGNDPDLKVKIYKTNQHKWVVRFWNWSNLKYTYKFFDLHSEAISFVYPTGLVSRDTYGQS